jgi:hypothetical protein
MQTYCNSQFSDLLSFFTLHKTQTITNKSNTTQRTLFGLAGVNLSRSEEACAILARLTR